MLFNQSRPRDALDPSSTHFNKARLWKTFPPSPLTPFAVTLFSGVSNTADPPLASTHSYKFKPHLFTSLLVACSQVFSAFFDASFCNAAFCSGHLFTFDKVMLCTSLHHITVIVAPLRSILSGTISPLALKIQLSSFHTVFHDCATERVRMT